MTEKIAMVIQRYGADVIGGAESHGRQLAERFKAALGWDVDVYTTTAKDYRTWANEFPEGEEWLNGVRIRRYNSRMRRSPLFPVYDRATARWMRFFRRRRLTRPLARLLEWGWIVLQGPYSPKLIQALKRQAGEYRKVIFMTYLYYPTLAGVPELGDKAILIPTAHDEPPYWFLTVKRMLKRVPAIVPNTLPEAGLIERQLDGVKKAMVTAGLGFDETVFVPAGGKSTQEPYVLYLGRISAGKGVGQLIDWFRAYCAVHPRPGLKLKLAGHREASVQIPDDPRIEYLGFVDDPQKLGLLRDAAVVVNPSPHESMSMIVIEAMAMKVPVLVNRHCEVLRYYTEQTRTVLPFGDEGEFVKALDQALQTDWREAGNDRELEATRTWALARFSWSHVLSVFASFVTGR